MWIKNTILTTEVFVARDARGSNLSFQDTGLCHSNRKSTTYKSVEILKSIPINAEKFLKSIPINPEKFLKIIPINPEMPKKLTNELILTEIYTHNSGKCKKLLKTIPINPDSIMKRYPKKWHNPVPWTSYVTPPPRAEMCQISFVVMTALFCLVLRLAALS